MKWFKCGKSDFSWTRPAVLDDIFTLVSKDGGNVKMEKTPGKGAQKRPSRAAERAMKGAQADKGDKEWPMGKMRIAPGLVLDDGEGKPIYDSPTIVIEAFWRKGDAARDVDWLKVQEECKVNSNYTRTEETGCCFCLPRCGGGGKGGVSCCVAKSTLTDELKVDKTRALQWGVEQEVFVLHLEDITSIKAYAEVRKDRKAAHTINNKVALEHQATCLSTWFPCMATRPNEKDETVHKVDGKQICERHVLIEVTWRHYFDLPEIRKKTPREPKVKITRTLGVKAAKGLLGETEEEQMKRIRWYMGIKKKELEAAQKKKQAEETAAALGKKLEEVKDDLEEEDKVDKKVGGAKKQGKKGDNEEKYKEEEGDKKKSKKKGDEEDDEEEENNKKAKAKKGKKADSDEEEEEEEDSSERKKKESAKKSKKQADKKGKDAKGKAADGKKKTAMAVKEDKDQVEWTEVAVTEWDEPEPEPKPEFEEVVLTFQLLANTDWTDEEFQAMYEDAVQLCTGITRLKRWSHLTSKHPSPEIVMHHLGTPYIYKKGTGVQEPPMSDSDMVYSNGLNERVTDKMKKHRPPTPGDPSSRGASCFQAIPQPRMTFREPKDDLLSQEKALIEARMLREQAELREKEAAARLAAMAAASASAAAAAAASAQVASAGSTPLKLQQQPSQLGTPLGSPAPGVKLVDASGAAASGSSPSPSPSYPAIAAQQQQQLMLQQQQQQQQQAVPFRGAVAPQGGSGASFSTLGGNAAAPPSPNVAARQEITPSPAAAASAAATITGTNGDGRQPDAPRQQ